MRPTLPDPGLIVPLSSSAATEVVADYCTNVPLEAIAESHKLTDVPSVLREWLRPRENKLLAREILCRLRRRVA